jgi:hypothetical protein
VARARGTSSPLRESTSRALSRRVGHGKSTSGAGEGDVEPSAGIDTTGVESGRTSTSGAGESSGSWVRVGGVDEHTTRGRGGRNKKDLFQRSGMCQISGIPAGRVPCRASARCMGSVEGVGAVRANPPHIESREGPRVEVEAPRGHGEGEGVVGVGASEGLERGV